MGDAADDVYDAAFRENDVEECVHEDYEIDILTGRATCDDCGHHWFATDAQMKAHQELASRCYECVCFKCNKSFFAESKRAGICPACKTPTKEPAMTEEQIKHMVSRFLGWRLPQPWNPDNGISYKRPNYAHAPAGHDWPTGTNLFDADQATAMVRYLVEGMPQSSRAQDL